MASEKHRVELHSRARQYLSLTFCPSAAPRTATSSPGTGGAPDWSETWTARLSGLPWPTGRSFSLATPFLLSLPATVYSSDWLGGPGRPFVENVASPARILPLS